MNIPLEIRRVVEQIIDLLELAEVRHKVVESLPDGLRKRVDLGRASCPTMRVTNQFELEDSVNPFESKPFSVGFVGSLLSNIAVKGFFAQARV